MAFSLSNTQLRLSYTCNRFYLTLIFCSHSYICDVLVSLYYFHQSISICSFLSPSGDILFLNSSQFIFTKSSLLLLSFHPFFPHIPLPSFCPPTVLPSFSNSVISFFQLFLLLSYFFCPSFPNYLISYPLVLPFNPFLPESTVLLFS